MGRKKRLNIVRSRRQYCSGEGNSSKNSLPRVEAPEAFEDDGIHDEQQHDETLQMSGDNDVKKRGSTMLPYVWDLPDGKRIVVKCNKLGQPIGAEGGLLGQFLGTIARNGSYCPLDKKTWRYVKKNDGDLTILQFVQTKFLYPQSCEKWILSSTGRDWRRYKAALKSALFNPKKKRSYLYKLCPEDIELDQWKALVKYWKSAEGKAMSEKNKRSRAMLENTHSAGTKSYARWSEDMRQDDPNKKQPHRAMVYLATHKKKGKDKDGHVDTLENLIEEQPELAQNDQGRVAWEGDALHQVLGKEKPGQVHGMGLLPVPKQVYGHTSHHLKNINITTVDHSSDQEMDVRGDVKELTELVKKQGKIIEELQNKQMCNEGSGPTKVSYQRTYNDKVQEQAVQTNRKRIQCDAPEQDDLGSEQRTTSMNKKRYREHLNIHEDTDMEHFGYEVDANHEELPRQDDSSSLPLYARDFQQEMNKKKQQKQQKTMKSGEKKDNQKNTTHQMVSNRMHSSAMKTGSTIVLLTAKYRRKEYVAYATFLTSNPREKVGGVEIGNEFTKVVVNHPIQESEELVRPLKDCRTIGDAHDAAMSIAWPSVCIEKIDR